MFKQRFFNAYRKKSDTVQINTSDVRSFDVFDTLLARNIEHPTDIFDIIEKTFPYDNFKELRIRAERISGLTLDTIYDAFLQITNESNEVVSRLKEFELKTEVLNSFLIKENCNLVNDGDILISDMYLSNDQILALLNELGFDKNVTVYSSSIGKSKYTGSMYEFLKKTYNILLHTGDNEHSDIYMANKYNIPTHLTTIHKFNKTESFFVNNNCKDFALLLRKFRLSNPYNKDSTNYNLYNDQIVFNIPLLILISLDLHDRLIKESRDTVLFYTRDGCLLKYIFEMISNFKAVTFHSSRIINRKQNVDYDKYILDTYNDDTCIIFDGHGSFSSGRAKYLSVLGILPRIHIFSYHYSNDVLFNKLTYNIIGSDLFEKLNIYPIGTLIDYKEGEFIRETDSTKFGFDVQHAEIYKDTILKFVDYYNNNIKVQLPSYTLIESFYNENWTGPSVTVIL